MADGLITVSTWSNSGDLGETGHIIVFRAMDEDNYYILILSGSGKMNVYKIKGGQWARLDECLEPSVTEYEGVECHATSNLGFNAPKQENVVAIDMQKDHFQVYVNDRLLIKFRDDDFPSGDIGLGAHAGVNSEVRVFFDHLRFMP